MSLPTRPLGSGGIQITTLGFGAWAVGGGGWAFSWGPQDDAESIATMRRASSARAASTASSGPMCCGSMNQRGS